MTTKLEQAARQALEALESCNVGNWSMAFDEFAVVEAITALREALAQQQAVCSKMEITTTYNEPQEITDYFCGMCSCKPCACLEIPMPNTQAAHGKQKA